VADQAELLGRLAALPLEAWKGTAFRHMFGSYPPDRENTSGAPLEPGGSRGDLCESQPSGSARRGRAPDCRAADPHALGADDMLACRAIGGAVASLACDGLLVPSARTEATNLVIFAANLRAEARFDVRCREELGDD
jgi:RES domain